MKKTGCLLLALVLLLGLLCACQKKEEGVPDGKLRVKSAVLDLWVFYPETWIVEQNDTCLKLVSNEEKTLKDSQGSLANVTVLRLAAQTANSLDAYVQESYRASFSEDYVFDGEPEAGYTAGMESYTFTYRKLSGETTEYHFRQCIFEREGVLWAITYTASPSLYETFLADANDLMQSLTFEEIEPEESGEKPEEGELPAPPEGYKIATNAGVDYTLTYPDRGWTLAQNEGILSLVADDKASLSVSTFWSGAEINSLEQYLDERYYVDFDALYGAHTERSRDADEPDGVARLSVRYDAEIEGVGFSFLQAMYSRAGYIYTVLYTAKTESFDVHLGEVEDILSRFAFK